MKLRGLLLLTVPALLLAGCGGSKAVKSEKPSVKASEKVVVEKIPEKVAPTPTALPPPAEPKLEIVGGYRKGSERIVEGNIDNVVQSQVQFGKQHIVITSVGFTSGDGISLLGVHAGISRGKHLRLVASYVDNVGGIDAFRLERVTLLGTPEPASAPTTEAPPVSEVAKP
jgi:hypothetical protein